MWIIDPGHGGTNYGTRHNGIVEKEFTLDFAKELQSFYVNNYRQGCHLTRIDDTTISFRERRWWADELGGKVVTSLHVNANKSVRASGVSTYYYPGNLHMYKLGKAVQNRWPVELGTRLDPIAADPSGDGNEWLEAPHNVVKAFRQPTLLVEMFFATNLRDVGNALNPEIRRQMFAALCESIEDFRRGKL